MGGMLSGKRLQRFDQFDLEEAPECLVGRLGPALSSASCPPSPPRRVLRLQVALASRPKDTRPLLLRLDADDSPLLGTLLAAAGRKLRLRAREAHEVDRRLTSDEDVRMLKDGSVVLVA